VGPEAALAEFAINNADSVLLTPFFIGHCAHPRLQLSPPRNDRDACESPAHYAQRMRLMEATVRELQAAAKATRKARLGAGRVHTVFNVGDRVLRTKELLDVADIGRLRPRWDGSFTVTACPAPNTLALPRRMLCGRDPGQDCKEIHTSWCYGATASRRRTSGCGPTRCSITRRRWLSTKQRRPSLRS
jgi:hypothetical protein